MDKIITFLEANQILSTGFLLGTLAVFWGYIRPIPSIIYQNIKKYSVFVIECNDREDVFGAMQWWLSKQNIIGKNRLISLKDKKDINYSSYTGYSSSFKGIRKVLAPGIHAFFYKKRLCILSKTMEKNDINLAFRESCRLTIFTRKQEIFDACVEEIERALLNRDPDRIKIYRHSYESWVLSDNLLKRSLDSIILSPSIKDDIIKDIDCFKSRGPTYAALNIPYKRGYLLAGPPGTGKTSLIHAIASRYDCDIYKISLASKELNDSILGGLFSNLPDSSIAIIEDIDCLFTDRDVKSNEGVTFSGLLNAIDGIGNKHGHILFMTTNHKEKLDSSLIRPGRADKHYYLDNPSDAAITQLIQRFRPNINSTNLVNLTQIMMEFHPSAAAIQSFLTAEFDTPDGDLLKKWEFYASNLGDTK